MNQTSTKTIIVAGIARSGLTVTMQMLHAGGYPCLGQYPAFEGFELGKIPWNEAIGKAVKVIDTHTQFPPPGKYYVIRLRRNQKEQAKSHAKLLKTLCEINTDRAGIRKIERSFDANYRKINGWMDNQESHIIIDFEDIITTPHLVAQKIKAFTGEDLDVKAMAAVVVLRDTKCHPTMLEGQFVDPNINRK